MKIARLLEFHNQKTTRMGLSLNLGDHYLVQNNTLFRHIRKAAIDAGFSYSEQFNSNYTALPLSQLETLLRSRVIPFFNNVSVLLDIESNTKGMTEWDEVTDNLKRNHVFHESCHAIARSRTGLKNLESFSQSEMVLKWLLEESFANACELLGIVEAEDSIHKLFYEINSYIFMNEDRSQLKKAVEQTGRVLTLKFLIFAYLFSNFLRKHISEPEMARIFDLLSLDSQSTQNKKTLRSIAKIAFELNPRFRYVTTTFYLKLQGHPISVDQISSIDFLGLLEKNKMWIPLTIDRWVDGLNLTTPANKSDDKI